MNERKFDVNNLRIASPCPTSWSEMSGDERKRFCRLCELNVYNISAMTEEEIAALVAESNGGRICGRLYRRADGSVLTNDCPVGLKAYRKRIGRIAGAAFAAVLGLFSVTFGQKHAHKKDRKDDLVIAAAKLKIERTASQTGESVLTGQISDLSGAVIPGIVLTLTNNNTQTKITAQSDEDGRYNFAGVAAGIYALETKALPGFKNQKITDLEIKPGEISRLNLELQLDGTNALVGIIIVSEPMIDTTSSGHTFKITRRMLDNLPFQK